jgi:hypothetical protein
MSEPYEEIVRGESFLRLPPGERHEAVCYRLHQRLAASLVHLPAVRLLEPRSQVDLDRGTRVFPDLALVATATGKAWLIAEVIEAGGHHVDTVTKKTLYEDLRMPRVWMVDTRYDNVEVYHGTPQGLVLKRILAGKDVLRESLVPEFSVCIAELFGP